MEESRVDFCNLFIKVNERRLKRWSNNNYCFALNCHNWWVHTPWRNNLFFIAHFIIEKPFIYHKFLHCLCWLWIEIIFNVYKKFILAQMREFFLQKKFRSKKEEISWKLRKQWKLNEINTRTFQVQTFRIILSQTIVDEKVRVE